MDPATIARALHWDDVFDRREREDLTWYEAEPTVALALIDRVTSPGDAVLDVGAGVSTLGAHLQARGHADLTFLDLSQAALDRLQAELGEAVQTICADLCSWTPPRQWDLWHDRAVLHFLVVEAQRQAYARTMLQALPSGGHALISTFAPDGPERCSGLPVRRYGAEDLLDLLGRDQVELLEHRRLVHATPRGGEQRFQLSLLRRR